MTLSERFLSYVSYPTMSDEASSTCPSSEKQLALARRLCDDLLAIGLSDARVDMYGYVYASIEKTADDAPSIGFIAHMDTAGEMPDAPISPRIVRYTGGDIPLSEDGSIALRNADFPALAGYRGHRLVVTDGQTLLGGDDKAGIAVIMEALARIASGDRPHGRIAVAFTPDEEIGRGTDHFDLDAFGCDYAYTVDGGALGELEYENFNAARATVSVTGTPIHPGSAKGRMRNAVRIAAELDALLPPAELPELTEGYEGFHHLLSLRGDVASATAVYLIRDHDDGKFEEKKETFRRVAATLNERYGRGTVALEITDSYYNMRRVIDAAPHTVMRARAAMHAMGISPIERPIRGGTDGAMLSLRGLPCPNLGMGEENPHSAYEFVSLDDMERAVGLLVRIAEGDRGV